MDTDDLYILQDGTHAAAGDVERGKDGVLRHKGGPAVCLDENGEPMTVKGTAERGGNVAAADAAPNKSGEPLATTANQRVRAPASDQAAHSTNTEPAPSPTPPKPAA